MTDDPARREESLFDAIPRDIRKVYRIRPIVEKIVDQGSFFEMGRLYGRSVVTGFARVDGWPVAVMASDPMFYGGGWTADACQKVARFVDLAETFHMPVVYFCDCPGFLIGLEAEKSGVIRQGVRAMSAMFQTHRAVVHLHHPQRLRRRGRRAPERRAAQLALCLAVGPLGLAAAGGRHRGRLPRRHRRAPTIPRPRWRRSRTG